MREGKLLILRLRRQLLLRSARGSASLEYKQNIHFVSLQSSGHERMYRSGKAELLLRVHDPVAGRIGARYTYYGQAQEGRWYGFGIAAGKTMESENILRD